MPSQQTNLVDPAICQAGKTRKDATATDSAAKYRDRAAERREVFNQSAIPLPEDTPGQGARKYADAPAPPLRIVPGLEPAKDEANVGNQLLAKMGWQAGTGLGMQGEGRVAPVLVQQFEARAGLGSSKGQEAGKYTGPGGQQARGRDLVSRV
jgi:RNA-binding protein 5/10